MPEHPILQALSLSAQQQAAIAGLTDDALITAGAGTGKTRTLTARYLQLLAQGVPLRQIVAITFTRKAAREMRNRIRDEIWQYIERTDISEADRAAWRKFARQLDAARISTIHGLCQEILRSHPVEARIDPDFRVLDENSSALMQEEALDEALFWAAGQTPQAELLVIVEETPLRHVLRMLIGRGSEVQPQLRALPDDPQALLQQWEQRLQALQQQRLRELMVDEDWRDARATIETARLLDENDKLAIQVTRAQAALYSIQAGDLTNGAARLGAIDLRGGRASAWSGGKEEKKAISEALKTLRQPFKNSWLGATLNDEDARSARALVLLKDIALEALRIYATRKTEAQALDFDDLEARAIHLLETHEAVRRRWQTQVQALLVDEFQDTNARQTRLLELLDGGRGVRFLVGDGKQSIYRFRGADVAIFQELRTQFAEQNRRVTRLDETWRAHPDLVQGLNQLLQPVMDPARHVWEAPFEPLQPVRPQPPQCPQPPYIEFYLGAGNKADGALTRSAQAVVQRLQNLLQAGACQPKDIAILTRASTSFGVYEDALDAAGIPFLTLAGRGFYQRPEIRDLVVLMRAAADPTDDVALAGALRSPGLGLSDVALYHLARTRETLRTHRDEPRPPLWLALPQAIASMDEDEQPRAERARQLLLRLNRMAGRKQVADLLKFYLDETDYLAILVGAGQHRAARNVRKLLADIQQAGFVQIDDFIDYVKLSRAAAVREGEAPVVAEGAVQIMSIHRAKGLEFPIVVLGDITTQPRGRETFLITPTGLAWKLPQPPGEKETPTFFQALQALQHEQETAEEKRLLYVAATRAQECLLFSGMASRKGWLRWLAPAAGLDEICLKTPEQAVIHHEFALGESGQWVRCTVLGKDWTPEQQALSPSAAVRPPRFLPSMLEPIAADSEALDEKQRAAETKPEQRVWQVIPSGERAWAPAWVVGTLIHRALELERFPDDARFDAWFRASARGLGLSDEGMLANARQRARRTLKRLQQHPFWQRIAAISARYHEIPYSYKRTDGRIDRGVIDMAWQEAGHWHLVDFKTDRVPDRAAMLAQIEEKDYRQQVQRYIRAMQTILGETPTAYLCFLDVAGEVAVVEVTGESEE